MAVEFVPRQAGTHRFRIYVPPQYTDEREWPAVLFLHGAGERGSDPVAPTRVGIGPALVKRDEPYPAFVIFPQCPGDRHWALREPRDDAIAALDAVRREFSIDNARVALTGISMGGNGAWLTAIDHPTRFVRLAPVCAWLTRSHETAAVSAHLLAHIPIWMFHGDADEIVPADASRIMHEALRDARADVRYTELPGVAHNSWDPAYQESSLLDWLIGR